MRLHHHPELAVVDLPVPVLVHRVNHLVDLLVSHLGSVFLHICQTFNAFSSNFARSRHLARQVGQHKLQLLSGDAPLVVLAEHPERLLQVVLNVGVLRPLVQHQAELLELKETRSVHVDLVDHILHLRYQYLTMNKALKSASAL